MNESWGLEPRKDREKEKIERFALGSITFTIGSGFTSSACVFGYDLDMAHSGCEFAHQNVMIKTSPFLKRPKDVKNKKMKNMLGDHQKLPVNTIPFLPELDFY